MSIDKIFEEQPRYIRAIRGFWMTNPLTVFGMLFLLGVIPTIYAVLASSIGDVVYYMPAADGVTVCNAEAIKAGDCIEKQVGYAYAINWWPALVILMPLALFFAFDSIQSMQRVFVDMCEQRMFCDLEWGGVESEGLVTALKLVVRQIWTAFAISGGLVCALIGVAIFLDWYCVVHMPLWLNRPLAGLSENLLTGVCSNAKAQENDWSIAATFVQGGTASIASKTTPPGWIANYAFSAYVYLLLLIELCILLAYFCFIFALSFSIYNINKQKFNLRIIPNLLSSDGLKRMGFESFEPVFRPCVYATIISFLMAFSMRIQNEYLRRDDYGIIYDFLFEDIAAALKSLTEFSISDPMSAIFGSLENARKIFDVGLLEDPNSLIGGPLVIVVFALVSVALGVVLRDAAREAKRSVIKALAIPETANKVTDFYGMSAEDIQEKLMTIQYWPLSWPRLRQSIRMLSVGRLCFIFYRIAFIWMGYVAVRWIQGKLSDSDKQDVGKT